MTLTDDALVRDLAGRADSALPPMSLDSATVLAAGRRYRRRRTVARSAVGTLAVAALALGATQVLTDRSPTPPAAQTRTFTVEGLDVTITTEVLPVRTEDGPMYDVGLPVDGRPGWRYALESVPGFLRLLPFDPTTGTVDEAGFLLGFTEGPTSAMTGNDRTARALGIVGSSVPELWIAGRLVDTLETFTVPGLDHPLFLVHVTSELSREQWPDAVIRLGVAGVVELDANGPRFWVPDTATTVETDRGPALELSGTELPDEAPSLLLVPVGVDETVSPHVLDVDLYSRAGDGLGEPLHTIRWPLETAGVRDADLDEAFDLTEDGVVRDGLVTIVGAVPPGADRTVLRVDEERVDLEPFTSALLPGRAVYAAVVDVSAFDELPEIAVSHTGQSVDTGWVLLP